MDKKLFSKIKLFISDIDGVLTSGEVIHSDSGHESRAFNVQDGFGIKILKQQGIEFAVISSKKSQGVQDRMAQLDLQHVYLGYENKFPAFEELISLLKISPEHIAYAGDDWPDIPILNRVGLPIAVANAVPEVKGKAKYVTKAEGGKGAIREVIMKILQSQELYQKVLDFY